MINALDSRTDVRARGKTSFNRRMGNPARFLLVGTVA
jgi:hypothetical protein